MNAPSGSTPDHSSTPTNVLERMRQRSLNEIDEWERNAEIHRQSMLSAERWAQEERDTLAGIDAEIARRTA